MPRVIEIAERPSIFERRASRRATDRGFVCAIGVERRIQIDEVYRLGINPPQDMQVIAFKNGSVFNIHYYSKLPAIRLIYLQTDLLQFDGHALWNIE